MDNTTLEGFDILIDYGYWFYDSYPITRFSSTASLDEALKAIQDITGKDTEVQKINTEDKCVFVKVVL